MNRVRRDTAAESQFPVREIRETDRAVRRLTHADINNDRQQLWLTAPQSIPQHPLGTLSCLLVS